MNSFKITPQWVRQAKQTGRRLAVLTAYDYPTARLLDEAGIPVILVGDSLGMVVLGFPDTTYVTLEHMIHHTAAVSRAVRRALLVADLPYGTYPNPREALTNTRKLLEAGAQAVKLEGGRTVKPQVEALVKEGISVMGHIGMLPQRIREEGGYRKKGKTPEEVDALQRDAEALVEAGVFSLVLESVVPEVAQKISRAVPIPTLGIGSGPNCDGQVRVLSDLLGLYPWFRPKFAQPYEHLAEAIRRAALTFQEEVEKGGPS
ncbi:3-methyl-2-oxobutanoate hydroxymethyltransferase [Candidatus Methylacidithermus pantelleriae]|uniref:3-methyl-2-oxobutanoate hydroxymethyltransferase n=1 Tax=Candidatus Methylacidithermus pantelleriae TaxID=2744239 RepID=A0A8J2BLV9_9BACT|nr:3-methyl-2-oxobutanoate hydroxymethyltransferase [Candidatus Methylacidithermus pantelleriae]CAF0697536.1 3-methyl-2-oxobutanoate hydroxymethyltransferase [Candidatus Methylacidithermus pantelleriae]